MKKSDVKVGSQYLAKVSDKVVSVRIDGENAHGGWDGTNLATGKKVRIKSAQRLRGPARTGGKKKTAAEKPTGHAPRSELTLEESKKLETARAKKKASHAKAAEAAEPDVTPTVEIVTGQPLPKPAQREKKARKPATDKPKRTIALDAAAEVLKAEGKPMTCQAMIVVMAERGLWTSPNGKTPQATLYSAILREIRKAVETATVSRFRKVERGQFEFNAVAAK